MDKSVIKLLISEAAKARMMAYAPYSNYLVGAALIVPSGNIFTGCNVENASYGLTNCAERTAVFKAVSEGQRHIDAIAIIGGPLVESDSQNVRINDELQGDGIDGDKTQEADYPYPCGACRQVLSEFLPESGDIDVIVARSEDDYKMFKLSELLPHSFNL